MRALSLAVRIEKALLGGSEGPGRVATGAAGGAGNASTVTLMSSAASCGCSIPSPLSSMRACSRSVPAFVPVHAIVAAPDALVATVPLVGFAPVTV